MPRGRSPPENAHRLTPIRGSLPCGQRLACAAQLPGGAMHDTIHREPQRDGPWNSEQAFKALVERCPEPVYVHAHGMLLYVNPAFLSWTGYCAGELIGRWLQDTVIHPDDREHVLA